MRYVDFDSPELAEYPDVKSKVEAGELEPGVIMIDSGLTPIWNVPYSQMVKTFEQKGAHRASRKVS